MIGSDRIRKNKRKPDKKINSRRQKKQLKKAAMIFEKFFQVLRPNTKRRYIFVLKHFMDYTDAVWGDITEQDVFAYWDYLQAQDYSGFTLRNQMESLKSMFEYLEKRGIITRNPFKTAAIRLPKKSYNRKRKSECVPFDQVLPFCNAPSAKTREGIRDRAFLAVLFGGALRISEAQNLRCGDIRTISVKNGVIVYLVLRQTKAGVAQEQALPHWAAERVLRLLEQRHAENCQHDEPLLRSYYRLEQREKAEPIAMRTLARIFHRWRKYSGLNGTITPHSARVTAISYLVDRGIPLREVQKFARHASLTTTENYIRLEESLEKSAAVNVVFS